MLGILSDKVSETYSTFPLHSCSRRQREWCGLWSFEHCPLYSFCTFIPENVDMIGCFRWLLTTNVNIKSFQCVPLCYSQSLCMHFHDHSGMMPLVNVCVCVLAPLLRAPSISELLETKHSVTLMPYRFLRSPNARHKGSAQQMWATLITKCLLNECLMEFSVDGDVLQEKVFTDIIFYLVFRLQNWWCNQIEIIQ